MDYIFLFQTWKCRRDREVHPIPSMPFNLLLNSTMKHILFAINVETLFAYIKLTIFYTIFDTPWSFIYAYQIILLFVHTLIWELRVSPIMASTINSALWPFQFFPNNITSFCQNLILSEILKNVWRSTKADSTYLSWARDPDSILTLTSGLA
jgi:hypothetical protein